jgi:uncharacterized membrane protein YidH (DUF202 family)
VSPRPTAADRLRDAVSLALLVGGVVLFAYAFRGMQGLAAGRISVARGQLAVTQWTHYRDLSVTGALLAALGIAVGVYSYLRRARREQMPR